MRDNTVDPGRRELRPVDEQEDQRHDWPDDELEGEDGPLVKPFLGASIGVTFSG
jgi:hypothetical protein